MANICYDSTQGKLDQSMAYELIFTLSRRDGSVNKWQSKSVEEVKGAKLKVETMYVQTHEYPLIPKTKLLSTMAEAWSSLAVISRASAYPRK